MRQVPLPRRRVAALVAAVLLLAGACASSTPGDEALPGTVSQGDAGTATSDTDGGGSEPAADATPWPHDFEADLVGGGSIDAGDYAGQDLVLWFWAPW